MGADFKKYFNFFLIPLVLGICLNFSIGFVSPNVAKALTCSDLFSDRNFIINDRVRDAIKVTKSGITEKELSNHVSDKIMQVPEFRYLRKTAEEMGLRVWLFGGTASSFLHYVKWDLARSKGLMDLQKDRFDYDFTNIFRSTQDLDIVVDAKPVVIEQFQTRIAQKYPHFLGDKANKWEVRSLRYRIGQPGELRFKEALLDDPDFNNQDTDSNSLGMVEVTLNKEPVIRNLPHGNLREDIFLEDSVNNRVSYFRSDRHFTTIRAESGENPEILSVLRFLVKAFQYELDISKESLEQIRVIINEFDPRLVTDSVALRRIAETARKLVIHAVNIEYAMNKLDELGLRQKLIAMGDPNKINSFAWWLNKEPLRSRPVGGGTGRTAQELGIKIVAHETSDFLAYESITRAHSGEPNVLISREDAMEELASFGEGFYTALGKKGMRRTGLTIRFDVDPNAREGTDFTVHDDIVLFHNKKALRVIPESLNLTIDDLLHMVETGQEIQVDHSNLALLEKLKRKLNASLIIEELDKLYNSKSEEDFNRLVRVLDTFLNTNVSKFISEETLVAVIYNVWKQMTFDAKGLKGKIPSKYQNILDMILKNSEVLPLAFGYGHIDLANFLLDRGIDINIKDKKGRTALHHAILNRRGEEVRYLLERGADIDSQDQEGKTALHLAIENNERELVKYLLEKEAYFDIKDKLGKTPLYLVTEKDDVETIKILLEKGASLEAGDSLVNSIPYMAAVSDRSHAVEFFLKNGDSRVRYEMLRGFDSAVLSGSAKTVELLLEYGAYPNSTDNYGKILLLEAVRRGYVEVVRAFLKNGADPNLRDNRGGVYGPLFSLRWWIYRNCKGAFRKWC